MFEEYRSRIESGEVSFGELASKFSDCSSAQKNGDLGPFKRGIQLLFFYFTILIYWKDIHS